MILYILKHESELLPATFHNGVPNEDIVSHKQAALLVVQIIPWDLFPKWRQMMHKLKLPLHSTLYDEITEEYSKQMSESPGDVAPKMESLRIQSPEATRPIHVGRMTRTSAKLAILTEQHEKGKYIKTPWEPVDPTIF